MFAVPLLRFVAAGCWVRGSSQLSLESSVHLGVRCEIPVFHSHLE